LLAFEGFASDLSTELAFKFFACGRVPVSRMMKSMTLAGRPTVGGGDWITILHEPQVIF
jgi:hypothetical protein